MAVRDVAPVHVEDEEEGLLEAREHGQHAVAQDDEIVAALEHVDLGCELDPGLEDVGPRSEDRVEITPGLVLRADERGVIPARLRILEHVRCAEDAAVRIGPLETGHDVRHARARVRTHHDGITERDERAALYQLAELRRRVALVAVDREMARRERLTDDEDDVRARSALRVRGDLAVPCGAPVRRRLPRDPGERAAERGLRVLEAR